MPATPSWSASIRRMHMLLALTVSAQLVIGLSLDRDRPWLFEVHEWFGLAIAAIVVGFWIVAIRNRAEGISHMFPWSVRRLKQVAGELRDAVQGRLPAGGPDSSLPGLIHGIGFLAATALAASGTIIFVLLQIGQIRTDFGHTIREIHETIATVLIAYWLIHTAMAGLHWLKGQSVVKNMWRLKSD